MSKVSTFQQHVETAKTSRWRRAAWVATVIVWVVIGVTGVQVLADRKAAERKAYDHLVDSSRQMEQRVRTLYSANRSILSAVSDALSAEHRGTSSCRLVCDAELVRLQKRYVELLPGLELLVMDPLGRVVAGTERDMAHRVGGLNDLAAHFRADRGVIASARAGINSRNEPAMLVAQAQRSPNGELMSITVLLEPLSQLNPILSVQQLGPGRAVTLTDANGILLARDPLPQVFEIGRRVQAIDNQGRRSGPAPDSVRARSMIDARDRLWIKREVPFSRAAGGLMLYVGMSVDDYLADWRKSTLLSLLTGVALLIAWIWSLFVFRRNAWTNAQLVATVNLMHQVMASTPVPAAVVSQAEGRVVMSNGAMLNVFGALAAVGQPVSQMFGDETVATRLRDGKDITAPVVELLSRKGRIYAELHSTDLGDLGGADGLCSLVVLIDVTERHKREQQLQLAATTDVLTGLANRRQFIYEAEQAIEAVRQQGTPLSILALDLDHFKRVNDQHGHDIGDVVLSMTARVFKGVLREGDLAARLGGEEFAALLPGADQRQAVAVGERIRQAISATPILLPKDQILMMTASIGVSLWHADDKDVQAMLKRADLALYAAKEKGRNRVETGDSDTPPA